MNALESLFAWVLTTTWQASLLAALVLATQWALGRRLNPRWRYALWLLVLLRLVLPDLPESALSVFRFAPAAPLNLPAIAPAPVPLTRPVEVIPMTLPPLADIAPIAPPVNNTFLILTLTWAAGALGLLLLTWLVNRRFARQVAHAPPITDPGLRQLFAEAKSELGIRRNIRLIESGQVQSPAIMGLFAPTLLLPGDVRDKFDPRELRFIFLHELAHLKRGDVAVQALIALLQIVHWFNPVLWFAFRRMRIDREPATDALVLSGTGEAEKEHYGLMLIKLLDHFNQRHSLPTLVGILEDKDQFKRRFSLIARFSRGAYGWSFLGIVVIGILSILCLTKQNSQASEPAKPTGNEIYVRFDKIGNTFGFGPIDVSRKSSLSDDTKIPGTGETLSVWCTDETATDATLVFMATKPSGPSQKRPDGSTLQPIVERREPHNVPLGRPFSFRIFDAVDVTAAPSIDQLKATSPTAAEPKPAAPSSPSPIYVRFDNIHGKFFGPISQFQTDESHAPGTNLFLSVQLVKTTATTASEAALLFHEGPVNGLPPMKDGRPITLDPAKTQTLIIVPLGKIHSFRIFDDVDVTTAPTADPEGKGDDKPVSTNDEFQSPLAIDIFGHDEAGARRLIEKGAPVTFVAMEAALEMGSPSLIKLLWNRGPHLCSVMTYAISQGATIPELEDLRAHGVPVERDWENTITPLGMAARLGNVPVAEWLVAHGAYVVAQGGRDPMYVASYGNSAAAIDFLVRQGVTVDAETVFGIESHADFTQPGVEENHLAMIQVLVKAGALAKATDGQKAPILYQACRLKSAPLVKYFLSLGFSPSNKSSSGKTVLDLIKEDYAGRATNPAADGLQPMIDLLEAAAKNPAAPATASTFDINGAVTDADGRPVLGAQVVVHGCDMRPGIKVFTPGSPDPALDFKKIAVSDAEGKFTLGNVSHDNIYTLIATAPGHSPDVAERVDPLAAPVHLTLPVLAPGQAGAPASGRIVDDQSRPIAGASIVHFSVSRDDGSLFDGGIGPGFRAEATSGTDGVFNYPFRPGWQAAGLIVIAPGYGRKNFPVVPFNGLARDLMLERSVTVTGRLLNKSAPLAGMSIGISQTDKDSRYDLGEIVTTTDHDGRFVLKDVAANWEYEVYAKRDSLGLLGVPVRKVIKAGAPGSTVEAGDLGLEPGVTINGQISFANGTVPKLTQAVQLHVGRHDTADYEYINLQPDLKFTLLVRPGETVGLSAWIPGYHLNAPNEIMLVTITPSHPDIVMSYIAEGPHSDTGTQTPASTETTSTNAATASVPTPTGAPNEAQTKLLRNAIKKNDATAVAKLVAGTDLNRIVKDDQLPLFLARTPEIAKILLDHGADPNIRDESGQPALTYLAQCSGKNAAEIVRVLLEHGADPNARYGDLGETALMDAQDAATVDVLVAHGADVKALRSDGMPGYVSTRDKPREVFDALLRHGLPFDVKTDGPTLLVAASWDGNLPLMNNLLDRGVDPSAEGTWALVHGKPDKCTPLENTAIDSQFDSAKLLVERGAHPNDGILHAIHNREAKIVKLLWEHGGVTNVSPLAYAISQGAPVADLKKLLDNGSPADPPQDEKFTPLAIAAQLGDMPAVQLLVQRGADVNKSPVFNPDYPIYQTSPLVMAASEGQDEIVAWLLAHAARPTPIALWQAANNSMPYSNQRTRDHFEKTVRILLDAGALKDATPKEKGLVLASGAGTRQGPPNLTVLKMFLDAGLSPELPMPYLEENGEKPNSIINYMRDWYAQRPKQVNDQTKATLDLLKAADKAAPPPPPASVPSTDNVPVGSDLDMQLARAALKDDPALVEKIIAAGADPNSRVKLNPEAEARTPLLYAVMEGRLKGASALLDHGAKLQPSSYWDASGHERPGKVDEMIEAEEQDRDPKMVKLFWDHGDRSISELSYAITQGASLDDVAKMLDAGQPVDPPQDTCASPLAVAAEFGRLDLVTLLLARGAKAEDGPDFASAVDFAAQQGRDDIVALLLQHGAQPRFAAFRDAASAFESWEGSGGRVRLDHYEHIMHLLLDTGAASRLSEIEKGRVLDSALGHPTLLKMLLDSGLSPELPLVDFKNNNYGTILAYVRAASAKTPDDAALKASLALLEAADKTAPASAPSTDNAPAGSLRLKSKIFEIGEKDYQAHRADFDAALAQGDAATLEKRPGVACLLRNEAITSGGKRVVLAYDDLTDDKPAGFLVCTVQAAGGNLALNGTFTVDTIRPPDAAAIAAANGAAIRPSIDTTQANISAPLVPGTTVSLLPAGLLEPGANDRGPHRLFILVAVSSADSPAPAVNAPVVTTSATPPGEATPGMVRLALQVALLGEGDYRTHQVEIDNAVQHGDVMVLVRLPSYHSIVNLPIVTKSGEQGVLEAVRVFPYVTSFQSDAHGQNTPSEFKKQYLGPRLVMRPQWDGSAITINGNLKVASVSNWAGVEQKMPTPIFHIREAVITASFKPGETKGFQFDGGAQMEPVDPSKPFNWDQPPNSPANLHILGRLFYFLTAAVYNTDGTPAHATPSAVSPSAPRPTPLPGQLDSIPLDEAIEWDNVDAARAQLDAKTDVSLNEMAEALAGRRNKIVKLFWDRGYHLCSPLTYAISQGATADDVAKILESGSAVRPAEDKIISPLAVAAVNGNQPVITLLLKHGADPNDPKAPGLHLYTSLQEAIATRRQDVVHYLLDHNAAPESQNVWTAISNCDPELPGAANDRAANAQILQEITSFGALERVPKPMRGDLLAYACLRIRDLDIVRLLLAHGYGPGDLDSIGQTTVLQRVRNATEGKDNWPPNPAYAQALALLEQPEPAASPAGSTNSAAATPTASSNATTNAPTASDAISQPPPAVDPAKLRSLYLAARLDADARHVLLEQLKDMTDEQYLATQQAFGQPSPMPSLGQVTIDDATSLERDIAAEKTSMTNLLNDGFTPDHPRIIAITQEIAAKQKKLHELITMLKSGATIDDQMAESRVKLLEAEAKPDASFALRKQLLSSEEDDDARRVLVDTLAKVPDNDFVATMKALGRADPNITALDQQIAQENTDIGNLLADGFGADHPRIASMKAEIAAREQQRQRFVDGLRRAMDIDLKLADSRVALLRQLSTASPMPAAGEIADLKQRVAAAKLDDDARQVLNAKLKPLGDDDFVSSLATLGRNDPDLDALDKKIADETAALQPLAAKNAASDHQRIQAMNNELDLMRQQRALLIDGIRRAMDIDLQMSHSRLEFLRQKLAHATSS